MSEHATYADGDNPRFLPPAIRSRRRRTPEMTTLLRIAAAKGGCPPAHATVTVPNVAPGAPQPSTLAVRAADGSEGTVPIPPDAAPGQTLRVAVPSAYPNWGPSQDEYAGDWVAKYDAGAHAPGRGTWTTERIAPRIHADPGFLQRQARIDGGEPPNAAAERFRTAAQRRNATVSLVAKRQQAIGAGGAPSVDGLARGATLAELRERNAEVVQLHADLVAEASAQPGRLTVGAPDSVAAAVGRLRSEATRRAAVTELRFICRQNVRSIERAHQTAAGEAGAIELLCDAIGRERSAAAKTGIVETEEESTAATWLLAQLCFKHRANCERLLDHSRSLETIVRQIIGIGQRKGSRLVLHAANESGLRAASFGLLCNLSSHGPDGTATAILQVGGARAALAVLAAFDATGALRPKLERQASAESDKPPEASRQGASREPELVGPYDGPEVELGLVLKAVLLLESLANNEECRAGLVDAGVAAALRPLATLSGLSTGHLPQQRMPFAGASLGAAAARVLAEL